MKRCLSVCSVIDRQQKLKMKKHHSFVVHCRKDTGRHYYHCKDRDGKDDCDDQTAEYGPNAGALVELGHQLSQRLQHVLLLGKENEQKDGEEE